MNIDKLIVNCVTDNHMVETIVDNTPVSCHVNCVADNHMVETPVGLLSSTPYVNCVADNHTVETYSVSRSTRE